MKKAAKIILYLLSAAPFLWAILFALLLHFKGDGWFLFGFVIYSLYGYIFCLLFIWIPLIIILGSRNLISAKEALLNTGLLLAGILLVFLTLKSGDSLRDKPDSPHGVYLRF